MVSQGRIMTLIVAALGCGAFLAMGLPLPFLFGPMAACLIAALAGGRLAGMGQVSQAARSVLGVAVGASLTPALIGQLPGMVWSVALVPVYIALIGAIGVPFFTRVCRFDRTTAFYASMPGGAADMVLFGEAAGADVRALSLIHATRILVIVTVAPIILAWAYDARLTNPLGSPASAIPADQMLILAGAAIVGWKGAERIGLFGAPVLGPLFLAAALSLGGVLHMRPPREALAAAQFFIGLGIGVHYVGVTASELRRVVGVAAAFIVVLALLAAVFTEIVTLSGIAEPVEAFLAFAPGGQAELSFLAIAAGADLGFVVVHHLTRVILVIIGAPLLARLFFNRSRES